jgi:putative transposase
VGLSHAHFLFRTGGVPLAKVMRRLLTGYAVRFNRRHWRHGQLFQNRYKSIVCQEDAYLKELVRYIHLNPIRAGMVSCMHQLNGYPYCGHSALSIRLEMSPPGVGFSVERGERITRENAYELTG